jgi:hypothetical protein
MAGNLFPQFIAPRFGTASPVEVAAGFPEVEPTGSPEEFQEFLASRVVTGPNLEGVVRAFLKLQKEHEEAELQIHDPRKENGRPRTKHEIFGEGDLTPFIMKMNAGYLISELKTGIPSLSNEYVEVEFDSLRVEPFAGGHLVTVEPEEEMIDVAYEERDDMLKLLGHRGIVPLSSEVVERPVALTLAYASSLLTPTALYETIEPLVPFTATVKPARFMHRA